MVAVIISSTKFRVGSRTSSSCSWAPAWGVPATASWPRATSPNSSPVSRTTDGWCSRRPPASRASRRRKKRRCESSTTPIKICCACLTPFAKSSGRSAHSSARPARPDATRSSWRNSRTLKANSPGISSGRFRKPSVNASRPSASSRDGRMISPGQSRARRR